MNRGVSNRRKVSLQVVGTALLLVAATYLLAMSTKSSCSQIGGRHCRSNTLPKFKFDSYLPSSWEDHWVHHAVPYQDIVCEKMLEQVPKSREWLDGIARVFGPSGFKPRAAETLDTNVFSTFRYVCTDCAEPEYLDVLIEPTVGLLRHPFGHEECTPQGVTSVQVEDRAYLLTTPLALEDFSDLYPGKRYLFDLGTFMFPSSLGWLTERYAKLGVEFDEVWAWEVSTLAAPDYWKAVPAAMQPKLHFYNIPVTAESNDPSNPLNTVRSLVRPGDFVVIKLDIDNAPLEDQFIAQIAEDSNLLSSIAELYFEKHFDVKEMRRNFGEGLPSKLSDTMELFRKLRNQGLRIHYWP